MFVVVVGEERRETDAVDSTEQNQTRHTVIGKRDPPNVRVLGQTKDARVDVPHGGAETEETEGGEAGQEIEGSRGNHDAVERLGYDVCRHGG